MSDSLSTTSAPRCELLVVEVGVHRDAHLPAAAVDVDGAVVVRAEQRPVGGRRLGELLDLLAERGDVLARLAQGVRELLVLRDGLGQLALRLEEALLERAHPLGRVLELPAQEGDLLLERHRLLAELFELGLVAVGHWVHLRSRPADIHVAPRAATDLACR